jgi:hypothetical protein
MIDCLLNDQIIYCQLNDKALINCLCLWFIKLHVACCKIMPWLIASFIIIDHCFSLPNDKAVIDFLFDDQAIAC